MDKEPTPSSPDPLKESTGKTSLWQELKRRHVVRVALVYAVVGWIVMQVASLTFEGFGIPIWAFRFVMLMVFLGFPISLVIAWAFELTPQGIKTTKAAQEGIEDTENAKAHAKKRSWFSLVFAAAVPTLIFGALAIFFFFRSSPPVTPDQREGGSSSNGLGSSEFVEYEKSIAVLPFTNMSANEEHAYFADGVHDTILTDLANLRELRVISRTSVLQYRGTTKTMPEIGGELGVAYLLEGSMQRAGDQFRLTAQLIDARTDEHLWAKNFDGEITNIFSVQSQLAKDIASALHAVLSPQEQQQLDRPETASIEAYDLYLQAQESSSTTEKLKLLDRAVEMDPTFTDAWLMIAGRIGFHYLQGINRTPENERKAKHAIDMAVRLEPDNPDVLVGLGNYHYQCHLNFTRARFYIEKVAERLPQHSEAQRRLGAIKNREGRVVEAISHYTRAQLLDPEYHRTYLSIGLLNESLREWKKAAEVYEIMLGKWPMNREANYKSIRADFYTNGPRAELIKKLKDRLSSSLYYNLLFLTGNLQAFKEEGIIDAWENENFRGYFSNQYIYLNSWQQAIVLKLLGESEKVEEVLKYILNEAEIRGKESYEDFRGQMMKGFAYALSGETENAQIAVDNAVAMLPESADAHWGVRLAMERAIALAWMGKKDESVAELARLSKKPNEYTNYYRLKHGLSFYPLRDHPGFQKLLNDPALKLPIPID